MEILIIVIVMWFFLHKSKDNFEKSDEKLLHDYIIKTTKKLNFDVNLSLPENNRRKTILIILNCLITILDLIYIFLYHNNLIIAIIIEIVNMVVAISISRKLNTMNLLKKKIKASPDDDMEYIISSTMQKISNKSKYVSSINIILIIISFVVPLIIFSVPHTIYEEDENGNYVVRYYTLSLINEKEVIIPEKYNGKAVVGIRGSVFINLFYIEKVELPDTIKEIRGEAFKNCYSLKNINIPKGIQEIKGNTFENDKSLISIDVPEGVERIGGHAFYGCSSLSSVKIPSTLKEIGSSAFRMCKSLKSISIPKNTTINSRAFKESPTVIKRY